jgi:HAD superfamily hydrolase (TIGR01509 family)
MSQNITNPRGANLRYPQRAGPLKAVFFDIGGTVVEVRGVAGPYRRILAEHGYAMSSEQIRAWLAAARTLNPGANGGAVDPLRGAEQRAARLDMFLHLAGVERAREACRSAMIESWISTEVFGLYPEAPAVLAALKDAGLIVGAVSNWEPRLEQLCERLGIAQYFDFILASEAEGYAKPDARLFELALQRAAVQPSEAVHVGDHLVEDVQAAEAARIRAVLVDRGSGHAAHSPRIRSLEAILPLALAAGWLQGRVVTGRAEASAFMRLPWVVGQVQAKLEFDPFPGTLNLLVERPDALACWSELRKRAGSRIEPAPGFCAARCYPVSIEGFVRGAILLPEVPGYPEDAIELIAPIQLRETLSVVDGGEPTLALPAICT